MVKLDWSLNSSIDHKIVRTLSNMRWRNSNETPEMWCDRIRAPFKKILEENSGFFSKNEYIQMQGKRTIDGKRSQCPVYFSNYIYCTVCDSLVFIPDNRKINLTFSVSADNHLKRCIAENARSISGECAKREEFLHVIARKENSIRHAKREILRHEADIMRIQLELSPQPQSLSHSEKDKLASISYDYNHISYETYRAGAASAVKDDTNPYEYNREISYSCYYFCANFCMQFFCAQSTETLMFHPDYKYITDKLPVSLKKRAYRRLLYNSRNPIPPDQISEKCDQIEDYLRHTLEIYQTSLDRKRKTMNCKSTVNPDPPEQDKHSDSELFTYELAILKRQLLEHNRVTFDRFMQDLTKTHEKQIEANRESRLAIEDLKMKVREAETILAYLASHRSAAIP
ncbi:hypothetical protein RhiirA4_432234 [Rhizophagus irregularis]|uniref:Uncharacterized protein n=1 Tax=Rhizophagus irregularis TaxID=588596 RepID=A0A2I1HT96_9GLOM|nr:hypothetical protein RhiirA4_432234 [Rhizophagus irregularis]